MCGIKDPHICERYIPLNNAHSALDDAKATVQLFEKYIEKALKNNSYTFNDLKKSGRTYNFISSWENNLPSYDALLKQFSSGMAYKRQ
ncbi:hypothetical protein HOC11_06830 [archaeon]|jgi:DNA polymerase III epsilon subunit-like protein|nr:hypothetical protein [archaeon]